MSIQQLHINNIIHKGIIDPIQLCLENGHDRAALQLIYCAIDVMTYLSLEQERENSNRHDYANWCDKYLKFNSNEKISGLEFFGSRSGIIHNYKAESQLSSDKKVRVILYFNIKESSSDIIYSPEESTDIVMVNILPFYTAFHSGVIEFLEDLKRENKEELLFSRLQKMYAEINV